MSEHEYRTLPDQTETGMPGGVPYIIGNEVAERFSFYGMKGILVVFMTQHLLNAAGTPVYMNEERANAVYHLFTGAAYFFPILGALLADIYWGKYKTILYISLMYCVGHGCLALMDAGPHLGAWDMAPFLYAGLIFIAVGAGGIKPCVSAHVGDQFGAGNKRLITQVFNWFYFAINTGAAASTMLTPVLLHRYGPWAAFGLPGVLMAVATFVFWLGRHRFVHIPPAGLKQWTAETLSRDGLRAILNLAPLFLVFVPIFWMLFDQSGSSWVEQSDTLDRRLGFVWLPSQIQSFNPVLILLGIPIFTYVVYPLVGKIVEPTPLRKIGFGLFLAGFSFVVIALIEADVATREDAANRAMFVDLAADAAAGPDILEGESAEDAAMSWTHGAVAAADVSGWTREEIAAYFGYAGEEEMEAALEESVPFEQARVVSLMADLSVVDAVAYDPGVLRAAVIVARNNAGWDEARIVGYLEEMPNVFWQFVAYMILTSAEILVSIVCLEFAYTQSPPKMKSIIMGVYFLGVSIGNFYIAGVAMLLDALRHEDGTTLLEGPAYFWFFAAVIAASLPFYVLWARTYKGRTYIQGEDTAGSRADAIGTEPR